MKDLRELVLQIEKFGEGATRNWHWCEMFDPLRGLSISRWDVELDGFESEPQVLRDWFETNEIGCRVTEVDDDGLIGCGFD
jgi:hypothetical protein